MLPSSRAMAKATGSTYYYTGKPCKYQHIAKRLTSSGECSECFKVRDKARSTSPARKERMREYHKVYQVQKAEDPQRLTRISVTGCYSRSRWSG